MTKIVLPRSAVKQYSVFEQFEAKLCARRDGIKCRIEEADSND